MDDRAAGPQVDLLQGEKLMLLERAVYEPE